MLLEVDHVCKRFGGVLALDRCSFSVPEGAVMGLIGPNGSGKTTLFDLVTGFGRPDSGRVTFRSRPIAGLRPDRVSRLGIGRTFQMARIFPRLTVLENLLVPVRRRGLLAHLSGTATRSDAARAGELLGFLGLSRLAAQPAGRLSFGQQKLLELGAVVMARPRLVLLDEPDHGRRIAQGPPDEVSADPAVLDAYLGA